MVYFQWKYNAYTVKHCVIKEKTDTSGFEVHRKGSQKQNKESSVTLLYAIAIPTNNDPEMC